MRRADLAERIDTVEHRMDSIEQRLDASYALLSTQILQSRRENDDAHLAMHARFETLEAALAEGLGETRRFMRVLHEEVLSRIALIGEGRPASS
jgi:hypothetical protein